MVVKVAMPEQFKLKIVPDIRNFFFSSQREINSYRRIGSASGSVGSRSGSGLIRR